MRAAVSAPAFAGKPKTRRRSAPGGPRRFRFRAAIGAIKVETSRGSATPQGSGPAAEGRSFARIPGVRRAWSGDGLVPARRPGRSGAASRDLRSSAHARIGRDHFSCRLPLPPFGARMRRARAGGSHSGAAPVLDVGQSALRHSTLCAPASMRRGAVVVGIGGRCDRGIKPTRHSSRLRALGPSRARELAVAKTAKRGSFRSGTSTST